MNETVKQIWALCDCPHSLTEWAETTAAASAGGVGLLLRPGTGLDPFFLMNKSGSSRLDIGLWMHLRDKTFTALESDLRTALAIGIETIIVGDPLHISSGARPPNSVGRMHLPRFVAFARTIAGDSINFGTVNRASDPADLRMLGQMLENGCSFAALPLGAWARFSDHPPVGLDLSGVRRWCWCRPNESFQTESRFENSQSLLIELDLADDSFAGALKKRLVELGPSVSVSLAERTRKGNHGLAHNN